MEEKKGGRESCLGPPRGRASPPQTKAQPFSLTRTTLAFLPLPHISFQLAEAERDLLAAQTAAEEAKAEYDALVARMESDLPRWEAARAGALAAALGAYAAESAVVAGEAARVWRGMGGAVGGGQ